MNDDDDDGGQASKRMFIGPDSVSGGNHVDFGLQNRVWMSKRRRTRDQLASLTFDPQARETLANEIIATRLRAAKSQRLTQAIPSRRVVTCATHVEGKRLIVSGDDLGSLHIYNGNFDAPGTNVNLRCSTREVERIFEHNNGGMYVGFKNGTLADTRFDTSACTLNVASSFNIGSDPQFALSPINEKVLVGYSEVRGMYIMDFRTNPPMNTVAYVWDELPFFSSLHFSKCGRLLLVSIAPISEASLAALDMRKLPPSTGARDFSSNMAIKFQSDSETKQPTWNAATCSFDYQFSGHKDYPFALQPLGSHHVLSTSRKEHKVWCLHSGKGIYSLKVAHDQENMGMPAVFGDTRFYNLSKDGQILYWNIDKLSDKAEHGPVDVFGQNCRRFLSLSRVGDSLITGCDTPSEFLLYK